MKPEVSANPVVEAVVRRSILGVRLGDTTEQAMTSTGEIGELSKAERGTVLLVDLAEDSYVRFYFEENDVASLIVFWPSRSDEVGHQIGVGSLVHNTYESGNELHLVPWGSYEGTFVLSTMSRDVDVVYRETDEGRTYIDKVVLSEPKPSSPPTTSAGSATTGTGT